MVVDSGGRINTIRSMSLSGGSSLVTIAATAVAARADVSMRVIIPDSDETFLDCGIVLEGTDFSWLRE